MKNEDDPENLKKHIHDLERKITQLKEDLEKERNEKKISWQEKERLEKENKDLKKQLAQLLGSAPTLATSDKTAEAGGVPSSKTFYRRNRLEGERKPRGGQPGHAGHGRNKPTQNSPPFYVELDECPDCSTPVGEPVDGAEQRRTITDIPLPGHKVYEIIYLRYW